MTVQTQMGHHLTEQDVEQNTCQDFLLCKIHLIAEEEIAPALQQTHETEFIRTNPLTSCLDQFLHVKVLPR